MSARSIAVAVGLASGLCAGLALAEPSIWQRARDPDAAKAESVGPALERMLGKVDEASSDATMMQDFRLGTLALAELSGADKLRDARLRLIVARALVEAEVERDAEAAELAQGVLADLGADETWLEAEGASVLALAVRRTPALVLAPAGRALALTWEPRARSELLRLRGEAELALGLPRRAIVDFRAANLPGAGARARSLSRFALGLALARAGDLPAAFDELRLARAAADALELDALEAPGAFRIRPHDARYAAALAAMAVAKAALDETAMLVEYEAALLEWQRFLASAPGDDPFRAAAEELWEQCERRVQPRSREESGPDSR